jgi:VCBS repeat-containing protein
MTYGAGMAVSRTRIDPCDQWDWVSRSQTFDAVTGSATSQTILQDTGALSLDDAATLEATRTLTFDSSLVGSQSFVAQNGIEGSNGYGTFSLTAGRVWHYEADNARAAIDSLPQGATATDSFTALSQDDAPEGTNRTFEVNSGATLVGTVLASDMDGDVLIFTNLSADLQGH